MLISKENAEKIARKSYRLFELGKTKEYMTFKKAMELDEQTGEKILHKIQNDLEVALMYEEAKSLGAKLHTGDDKIIVVDNFQYVESVSYDTLETAAIEGMDITGLEVKMVGGETIDIPNLCKFYAPHIYGHGLTSKHNNPGYPEIKDPSMRAVYLKLLISEDRKVNPYLIRKKGYNGLSNKLEYEYTFCFPMEETMGDIAGLDEEIDLLNDMFDITHGRFFSEGKKGGYADISIKATILYLEGINEIGLANRFRAYERNEYQYLNHVLECANNGYNGITFNGSRIQVELL